MLSPGSVSKACTPVVHIKIAGKWMFIPLKIVLIGIASIPTCVCSSHAFKIQVQVTIDSRSALFFNVQADVCRSSTRKEWMLVITGPAPILFKEYFAFMAFTKDAMSSTAWKRVELLHSSKMWGKRGKMGKWLKVAKSCQIWFANVCVLRLQSESTRWINLFWNKVDPSGIYIIYNYL